VSPAQWELNDGAGQVGPLEEDHVIRMLTHGIPEHTVVRRVGEAEWRSPRTHAPFAIALGQRAAMVPIAQPQQAYPQQPYQPPQGYYPAPPPPQTVYLQRVEPERSLGGSFVRVIGALIVVCSVVGMIPGCLVGGPLTVVILLVVMVLGLLMARAEG